MSRDFNEKTRKDVRILSSGYCCICHQHIAIQFHHLLSYQEGGDDSIENCVPLCLNCHNSIHTGGRYNREEVSILRNTWYRHVKETKTPDIVSQELRIQDEVKGLDDQSKLDKLFLEIEGLKLLIKSYTPNTPVYTNAISTAALRMATVSSSFQQVAQCPICNTADYDYDGVCPHCGYAREPL